MENRKGVSVAEPLLDPLVSDWRDYAEEVPESNLYCCISVFSSIHDYSPAVIYCIVGGEGKREGEEELVTFSW